VSKTTQVQTNFTAGELSPRLLGRTDIKKYNNGTRTLENFLVQTHGGIERRPGTRFVTEAYGTVLVASPPRLVEFQYNVEQNYILEFGATALTGNTGYIRFLRLEAGVPTILIDTTPEISGGTEPTLKGITLDFNGNELKNLQFTQSADVLYVFNGERPIYTLSRTSASADNIAANWSWSKYITVDGPYVSVNSNEDLTVTASHTSGNGRTLTASSALFVATDVGRSIRIEDDSEGFPIISVHTGTEELAARVTINDAGELRTRVEVTDPPVADESGVRVEFIKVTRGLVELNDTVWVARNWTGTGSANSSFELYNASDGALHYFEDLAPTVHENGDGECRMERVGFIGWAEITAYTSSTVVTVDIKETLPTKYPTSNFRLGAWSETTGYPRTGRFFQDRLWSASSPQQPQTIWSTETGLFNCYRPTQLADGSVVATNGMTVTLSDDQVNQINYLTGDTAGLIILTSGGEWLGRASTSGAALTPLDMSFQKQSRYGATSTVEPVRSGTSVLFVQRDLTSLRDMGFDYAQDRYVAPNITLLAEHIASTGFADVATQEGQSNRVWFPRLDSLLFLTTHLI